MEAYLYVQQLKLKMTFSFAIVSNIANTTVEFVNNLGAKIQGNGALEFKQATQSVCRLESNCIIAFW